MPNDVEKYKGGDNKPEAKPKKEIGNTSWFGFSSEYHGAFIWLLVKVGSLGLILYAANGLLPRWPAIILTFIVIVFFTYNEFVKHREKLSPPQFRAGILIAVIFFGALSIHLIYTDDSDSGRQIKSAPTFRKVTGMIDIEYGGGNVYHCGPMLLNQLVPFDNIFSNPVFGGPSGVPGELYFDVNGELTVNAIIQGPTQEPGCVIRNNSYSFRWVNWDGNDDDRAIEIVDENQTVIFQVDRLDSNRVSLMGYFFDTLNTHVHATNDKFVIHKWRSDQIADSVLPITPLFRYPSSEYPHKRVTRKESWDQKPESKNERW